MKIEDKGRIGIARSKAQDFAEKHLDTDEDDSPSQAVAQADRPGFMSDARAQSANSAMRVVQLIVALTVGAIVAAFLLPIGIDELASVNDTSSWSDGAAALWGIIDVIIVLAVFLFFIGIALRSAGKI